MELAAWLKRAYEEDILLTGIIYLHPINEVRLNNAGMLNLRMFKRLCGRNTIRKVVIATTFWDFVTLATGQDREDQLKSNDNFWGAMIKSGSHVFRHDRDQQSAKEIVEYLASKRDQRVPLAIQEEMVDQDKKLDQTDAGMELDAQLLMQKKTYEEKLANVRAEMKEALAARDCEWQEQLQEMRREVEKQMEKDERDRKKLEAANEELMEMTRRELEKRL